MYKNIKEEFSIIAISGFIVFIAVAVILILLFLATFAMDKIALNQLHKNCTFVANEFQFKNISTPQGCILRNNQVYRYINYRIDYSDLNALLGQE